MINNAFLKVFLKIKQYKAEGKLETWIKRIVINTTIDYIKSDKSYRKNFSKSKLIRCAQLIKKYDMPTMWFFMIGAPGETEETIIETFEFIDEHIFEEDMVHITEGIRIIPNTELYNIALEQNVISEDQSFIEPMYYVDPKLGTEKLTSILEREIAKRPNVMNSIDTSPSKELMKAAIEYRKEHKVDEPMFRTLLRVEQSLKKQKVIN